MPNNFAISIIARDPSACEDTMVRLASTDSTAENFGRAQPFLSARCRLPGFSVGGRT
ncbi:MAG: hypothetical protein V7608_5965 [Hyphomicrobiales bacterium]|jgi:hypothetical protein